MDRIPGEQLAQNVLDANLVNVLGLVIVLLVVVIIVVVLAMLAMMYYNSKGIATMTATQQNMANANAQWAASDAKKTEALNRSVDEQTMLRQDFATSTYSVQKSVENVGKAVEDHDAKVDDRVKSIIEHVTQASKGHTEAMVSGLDQAVTQINEATIEAVRPALEVIDSLKRLNDTISTRHDATMELLRKQHEDQLKFMEEQNRVHTEVINNELTRAQQQIVDVLNRSTESPTNDTPIEPEPPAEPLSPVQSLDVVPDDPVPAGAAADDDTRPGR